jgi:hypothetical protein
LEQFKFNGHGVHICKESASKNKKVKKISQPRRFRRVGEHSQMLGFTSITKISSTSNKSKKLALIFTLFRGTPYDLLKSINPSEASLLDAASRCHVRFRLGGSKFPPLIYYKIFSHGGVVDINAFAPRDYMALKKEVGKQSIDVRFDKHEKDQQ